MEISSELIQSIRSSEEEPGSSILLGFFKRCSGLLKLFAKVIDREFRVRPDITEISVGCIKAFCQCVYDLIPWGIVYCFACHSSVIRPMIFIAVIRAGIVIVNTTIGRRVNPSSISESGVVTGFISLIEIVKRGKLTIGLVSASVTIISIIVTVEVILC